MTQTPRCRVRSRFPLSGEFFVVAKEKFSDFSNKILKGMSKHVVKGLKWAEFTITHVKMARELMSQKY